MMKVLEFVKSWTKEEDISLENGFISGASQNSIEDFNESNIKPRAQFGAGKRINQKKMLKKFQIERL